MICGLHSSIRPFTIRRLDFYASLLLREFRSRSRAGIESNLTAEGPQAFDVIANKPLGLEAVAEVGYRIGIGRALSEQIVEDYRLRMAHRYQSAFSTASTCQAPLLRGQVTLLGVASCPGGLGQGSFQPVIARGAASPSAFTGTVLVSWTHSRPKDQVHIRG